MFAGNSGREFRGTLLAGFLVLGATVSTAVAQQPDVAGLGAEQRLVELNVLALSGEDELLAALVAEIAASDEYMDLYNLGRFFADRPSEYILPQPDYDRAIEYLERALALARQTPGRLARQFVQQCTYEIARAILRNRPSRSDVERAERMLQQAGDQGLADAALAMARGYRNGEFGTADTALSEQWYRRALSQAVGSAAVELSEILAVSDDPQARAEATTLSRVGLAMLQREALDGSMNSAVVLANTYLHHLVVPHNEVEAQRWLNFAAGRGSSGAMVIMAERVAGGALGEPNPALARDYMIEAANRGSTEAAIEIAQTLLSESQSSFEIDETEALVWLGRLTAVDNPDGYYIDAMLAGQTGDFTRRRESLSRAADLGNIDAMFALVDIYLAEGQEDALLASIAKLETLVAGSPSAMVDLAALKLSADPQSPLHDVSGGLDLLNAAASQSSGEAAFMLSEMYETGSHVEQNRVEAQRLLEAAATYQHLPAVLGLAARHANGTIQNASLERAQALLNDARSIARERGSNAMLTLGRALVNGIGPIDVGGEGLTWIERAVQAGNPRAMVALAGLLLDGPANDANVERAMDLYRQAIDAGDLTAHYQIGMAHWTGLGMPFDPVTAMEHFQIAAAAGSADAAVELGLAYAAGTISDPDPENAYRWLLRAAEAGNAAAMMYIANMIAMDALPEFGHEMAMEWMVRAASSGDVDAQFQLASVLANGLLGEADVEGAVHWMSLAAENGNFQAQIELRRLQGDQEDEDG